MLVVPEVNLVDWESVQPAPWLPGDGLARWYRLLETARTALREEGHGAVIWARWRCWTWTAASVQRPTVC
ncbi:MAG: hypothetical protein R2844_00900 [Caldilineales bacterium]